MKKYTTLCFLLFVVEFAATDRERYEDCQRRADDELVWEYDVRRSYRLGTHQEAEAEYGPTGVIITCIRVDSLSVEDNEAVWVTGGGIGQNFLKLKFRSKYSRSLRYKVYVYGVPTIKRTFTGLYNGGLTLHRQF